MEPEAVVTAVIALLASALVTKVVCKLALSHGVLDIPNERSSHSRPTPRGGGIAIVTSTIGAFAALTAFGFLDAHAFLALAGGGIAVAIVGFMDDRHQLSAAIRLGVHLLAALWALFWLGGLSPLSMGGHILLFGWAGYPLGALGIVWTLNLFNFMDGIDGIAASEATFISWGCAFLAVGGDVSGEVPEGALVFGAACAGFLLWNWPPAKIFLGDVGSGYLGFTIAVLALAASRDNPVSLWIWLILGGVFVADTIITLARRLARRERIHEAHRTHAYQWLARYWGGHRKVTVAVIFVNTIWLLPCAYFASRHPTRASWIAVTALAPLFVIALISGAGRPEQSGSTR